MKKTISDLPNLVRLELYPLNVDDSFFQLAERNLTSLEVLHIYGSNISDLGLASVSKLYYLRKLHISWCDGISDEGLSMDIWQTAS